MKKTRNIYWTPKLHKHPSKARLIMAALQCSVEPLPKDVASVLNLKSYNYKINYFSAVKSFWPVQSNQPTTGAIKKRYSRNKTLSIATYGLSTFFTNIPQNKLKAVMRQLTILRFQGVGGTVYCCKRYNID